MGLVVTDSISYVALAGGPSVSATVPASGQVLVTVSAQVAAQSSGGVERSARMSFASSGGSGDVNADDRRALAVFTTTTTKAQGSATYLMSGLSPGSHTFTAQYRADGGGFLASFANRSIVVIPLP